MLKKNLPIVFFLVTLILLMGLTDGCVYLLNKHDPHIADRMLSLLSQGKLEEANRALNSIIFYDRFNPGLYYDPSYHQGFLHSLALSLGETEIVIRDTVDLRKYGERIESWPQPLRANAKNNLFLEYWLTNPQHLTLKGRDVINARFSEIMGWDQADREAMRSFYAKTHSWRILGDLEPILIETPLIITLAQFFLIGPILLIFLLWEWLLERKNPAAGESFSTFKLSPGQEYLALGIYLLTLVLTYIPGIPVLRGKPFMPATTTYFIYLLFLPACIVLIMPSTIFAILKQGIRRMRMGNDIADRPRREIVMLSWIKQYKFFLWRLWPVWLVSGLAAWLFLKLYSGYQVDIFGVFGILFPW